MSGNGWCTHPKRQQNSGVKLLVRGGELACRNSWGGDLFQSRRDDPVEPAAAADLPASDQDDEITSVTIPSTRDVEPEDRVLNDRPAAQRRPPDTNDPAHRDQEERARLMARGSRDALAHARQRFSTRRQPGAGDDVVADDDPVDDDAGDRIITRQARFSDRNFAAGLPPMRTAPVPREEVEQRGGGAQDRFDVVPEIDPDFDMPAQRRRREPEIPAEPDPTPAGEPESDEVRLTAYEHVLQRARRIRATKQERQRPIRHADLLAGHDQLAHAAPDDHYRDDHYHYDQPTSERRAASSYGAYQDDFDDLDSFEPAPPYNARVDEQPLREVDREPAPEAWEDGPGEPDIGPWDDGNEERVAEAWDDDDAWYAEDDALYEPEPRRRGWLNRFGLGRRSTDPVYDDATVTRHAASRHDWPEDEALDDVTPGWEQPAPSQATSWSQGYDDDLPERRPTPRPQVHADAFPDPAPVPPPVPTAERTGDFWTVESMPSRPAAPSQPRQRLTAALPDLGDELLDAADDQMVRAQRAHWTQGERDNTPSRDAAGALQSRSPRDSFFRSSRFAREEPAPPFDADREPDAPEARSIGEAPLPDLEGDRLDLRDVVARGSELIDRRIEVAPDVPRQCRTCRSFRSADGGTRGWCTNEWAFTHRRMVNDDDLACVSAIGCWWLPADHLRLDLDDEIDEARTPRMDEMIASNKPAARRVAGE